MRLAVALLLVAAPGRLSAQPTVVEPGLAVRPVVSGLNLPTSMVFLGANDILVLEKNSGQVKRVVDGVVQGVVLDLAVNSASERGLAAAIDEACAPATGARPACYTDDGAAWVAGVEAEVDEQSPLIFCGP